MACAAYRTGDKLYDERYDLQHDYKTRDDVVYSEVILPEHAPAWMNNREKLWNYIEKIERRKDARLSREFEMALPRELTGVQHIELVKEFIAQHFTARGLVVDCGIHASTASDGAAQPHAHIMVVERELSGSGFGKKYRELNNTATLYALRKDFSCVTNKHLAMHGYDIRVDHRSLKDQGIDLIPQKKLGPTGSFHHMASYQEQMANDRENGERLMANPEIVFQVLANQQSTFTHQDIARIVNRYTADGDQFLAVYEKVKASPELVPLGVDDCSRERFTTREMVRLETEMLAQAQALHQKASHVISDERAHYFANKHQLSIEQSAVLDHILAAGDLKNIVGYAGTGKSRLLGAAREAWEEAGYRVHGATLSGIAAEGLEGSSGIQSRTLASRMHYWERGEQLLGKNDILVIDEAGMLGTRQMAEIMDECHKYGAKVVLVGDPEQLQAIEAGAAFRGIVDATSHIELTEIWRQQVDWQKQATIEFASGKTKEALTQYVKHDCVSSYESKSLAQAALIDAWNDVRISQPDKSQIILAYTRQEVAELNERAREVRQSLGELGESVAVETERGPREFAEGERVYFLKNDRDLGVKNGTLGTIVKMAQDKLTVQLDKSDLEKAQTIQFDMSRYNHLDYGYAATAYKAQSVTVDRSYVMASRYMNAHATYVTMTRHREGAELFWAKDEFSAENDMLKYLSRDGAKDLATDYLTEEFNTSVYATYRGLDTLWDNFWEKYGALWLARVQRTLSNCLDYAKESVFELQNKLSGAMDREIGREDEWLKEMRAWVDVRFGRSPDESAPNQKREIADSRNEVTRDDHRSLGADNRFATKEDRDAHYNALYQQILKDEAAREAREDVREVLGESDKSYSRQTTKIINKDDKEIDF